jgi:hypothetical protein
VDSLGFTVRPGVVTGFLGPLRRVGLLLEAKAVHTRLGILVIASASAVDGAIVWDPRRR